jgi:hypothetical protein
MDFVAAFAAICLLATCKAEAEAEARRELITGNGENGVAKEK